VSGILSAGCRFSRRDRPWSSFFSIEETQGWLGCTEIARGAMWLAMPSRDEIEELLKELDRVPADDSKASS